MHSLVSPYSLVSTYFLVSPKALASSSFLSPRRVGFRAIRRQTGKASPLFIVVAIMAVAIGLFLQVSDKNSAPIELEKVIILPQARNIEHIDFTDHQGATFGKEQFEGKWSILFFGFTHCPDICPSTMAMLKQLKQQLRQVSAWSNYQAVMITVDPERDTSERLANYVPFFDSEFIGLSSDAASTEKFAKQLGILFVRRDPKGDNLNAYDVDHSASLILLNPKGEYAGIITAPHDKDQISRDLVKLAKLTGKLPVKIKKANKSNLITTLIQEPVGPLTINRAWIRPAPKSATSMAAYFDLTNHTDKDIHIVNAKSSAFGMAMIHETVIEDGIASMHHLDELVIPAGKTISLKPMEIHMMLMRPTTPLGEGSTTQFSLIDDEKKQYDFEIKVRQLNN